MATLAQAILKDARKNAQNPTRGQFAILDLVANTSTATICKTVAGDVANCTGVTTQTGRVIVVTIGGGRYAIGWIR